MTDGPSGVMKRSQTFKRMFVRRERNEMGQDVCLKILQTRYFVLNVRQGRSATRALKVGKHVQPLVRTKLNKTHGAFDQDHPVWVS